MRQKLTKSVKLYTILASAHFARFYLKHFQSRSNFLTSNSKNLNKNAIFFKKIDDFEVKIKNFPSTRFARLKENGNNSNKKAK